MNKYQITTVSQLAKAVMPLVALPPCEEGGEPIYVRLKRPDTDELLTLSGNVPNSLLSIAAENLEPDALKTAIEDAGGEAKALKDTFSAIDTLVKAALVSPRWDEKDGETGYTFIELLTLEQKMEIVAYAGGGIKAMSTFREQSGDHAKVSGDGEGVGGKTEQLPTEADNVGSVLPGRSVRLCDEREAAGAGGTKPSGSRTTAAKKVGRPKKTQKTS